MAPAGSVFLLNLLSVWSCVKGNSLVGPGAVGSYQGGARGRRFGGYVHVQEAPQGFFLAGSTVRQLNGLYGKVDSIPSHFLPGEAPVYAYKHDINEWYLMMAPAPEEIKRSTGRETRWLLIDSAATKRFWHEGDTLIPGFGTSWSHVHEAKSAEPDHTAGTAMATAVEDDEEELPWQVIGVGSLDMLDQLRGYFRFYQHEVQNALEGTGLQPKPTGGFTEEEQPPETWQAPPVLQVAQEEEHAGRDACAADEVQLNLLEEALSKTPQGDIWAQVALRLQLATCLRRARDFPKAQQHLNHALAFCPRYKAALQERGIALLDEGRYQEAVTAFQTLLRLDRNWPDLLTWLVRAHALEKRETPFQSAGLTAQISAKETEHCIAWRQTGGCSPEGPREPERDLPCSSLVPEDSSGWCHCKLPGESSLYTTELRQAALSVCGHASFTCADMCREASSAQDSGPKASTGGEVDPCTLPPSGGPPEWCSANHYVVLGIRSDLPGEGSAAEEELKRAYKRKSLQVHPDKRGGSAKAFQRVAAAHEVLSNPEKRKDFDLGADFPREELRDGTDGPSHSEQVEKRYFPERHDFQPFGDPHSSRKEAKARKERYLEQMRQDALAHESAQASQEERAEL